LSELNAVEQFDIHVWFLHPVVPGPSGTGQW